MKTSMPHFALIRLLAFGLASAILGRSATKARFKALRAECARIRNQTLLAMGALKRLDIKGVELRPEFEKYKTELAGMET